MRIELSGQEVCKILEQWARQHLPIDPDQIVDVINYQYISIFVEDNNGTCDKVRSCKISGCVESHTDKLGEKRDDKFL